MAARERHRRLQALEQRTARSTHKTALVFILTCEATPDQQAAIDEAKRTHRPTLIIRSVMPALPPGYGLIVEVGNESLESNVKPKFDKATMRQDVWGR